MVTLDYCHFWGSHSNFVFNRRKNCQTVSQSSCTNLPARLWCTEDFAFCTSSPTLLYCPPFLFQLASCVWSGVLFWVYLHFLANKDDKHLSMCSLVIRKSLWRNIYSGHLPILKCVFWLILSFYCWVVIFVFILWMQVPYERLLLH